MKFTEGMWKVKDGVTLNWMSNVERATVSDDQVDLLLTKITQNRGDKINYPTLSANVRSPLEGVIAVRFSHWHGEEDLGPNIPVFNNPPHVEIETHHGKALRYKTGLLNLSVNTDPNQLAFSYTTDQGKSLTGHSSRSIALVADGSTAKYRIDDQLFAEKENLILLELDLAVHEKIYGLGERFGPFIKSGQQVEIWNEDGGTSSELAYKNIPFYISSHGYGIFINNPGKVMYEIQSERTTRVNIAVKTESLEYMIIAGPRPKDILSRYTALTGRPALPPAWSYGLWLTTSFTTSYDEKTVTGFLDGLKARSIPLSVFHFDAYWMKAYQWCDFCFDDDYFPDVSAYIARLKANGLRLSVWMNPYVAQSSPLFSEGKKNGYFIMRADRPRPTVWQWDLWQAGMAIVDFTNPAARTWFSEKLNKLLDLGIDSFKTDFGERIPWDPDKVRYYDNSDPVRMHNFYSYIYNKTVWETMLAHPRFKGNPKSERPCLFARSATAGGQQFPVHWGGDCESTFPAMAETLRGGLSLSLSGFGFWAHDIGGFEGLPPPSLYKRWVQFGLLSSHSRLHGSSSYRVPWIYDEEAYPGEAKACSKVLRDCARRKISLMPYLLRVALDASHQGTPVMRPMLLEFGEYDHNVWSLDTQYMLGPDLLVAPIFEESGTVKFYVPKSTEQRATKFTATSDQFTVGTEYDTSARTDAMSSNICPKWRSWFNHSKTYEEGQWYEEEHGFDTLPLLVRPGAVIPINPALEKADGDLLSGLQVLLNGPLLGEEPRERVIEIVEPSDVGRVSERIVVREKDGELEASRDADGVKIGVEIINMAKSDRGSA